MNTWKTPKGTTLYLINLKGKPYLPVAERLVWFREEHPDWTIETEIKYTANESLGKAWIKDASGRTIAMAHKLETIKGFADYIEKSETGSLGRALAMCGFGTQFCADDFNESDRIVDSPRNTSNPEVNVQISNQNNAQNTKVENTTSGTGKDFVIPFGKNKGKKIGELDALALSNLLNFVKNKSDQKFRDSSNAKQFVFWAEAYLKKNPFDDLDKALGTNEPAKEDLAPPPDFYNQPAPDWGDYDRPEPQY